MISLFLLLALIPTSHAAEDEIYTSRFGNAAASGYDEVAYFTAGKPV
ncbi:MAG: YHS domain protein, partial [Gammaproteobacteria bacterium]|nr:YHS domain protein [Gammaproteobacteria bacterium]